jgi:anti-sigma factor RsiW
MPATNAKTESGSFSAEERAAMKKRAAELRAEGKKGAKKADGLQAVLDSIAEMAPQDRALAERSPMVEKKVAELVKAAIS